MSNTIEQRLASIEQMMTLAFKRALTAAEAGMMMGVSESRVRHLASAGEIAYYKLGGRTVFSKDDIEQYMLNPEKRIMSAREIKSCAATKIACDALDRQRRRR
jgi:excisionase family DNA binding protein